MSRAAKERFWFSTPPHLMEAARAICIEPDREYPYLAEFHLKENGRHVLFGLNTISRKSGYHGEYISRTGWDVDWIEREQQYAYHQSSGGGSLRQSVSGLYWRHPAMLHVVREETARYCDRTFRKRNRTRRLRRIPINLHGADDLMQFLLYRNGMESEVYYCTICEEYLPDESNCEHVWWCDTDGMLKGPGHSENPEPCPEEEECYDCDRGRQKKTA